MFIPFWNRFLISGNPLRVFWTEIRKSTVLNFGGFHLKDSSHVRPNTGGFLISVQKTRNGLPEIKNLFQKGINTTRALQGTSYKTLVLKVGFDDYKHGYLNPCKAIREKTFARSSGGRGKYRPVQFFPTNPSDSGAGITNVALTTTANGQKLMLCEEGM